jgi:hypothetical protein
MKNEPIEQLSENMLRVLLHHADKQVRNVLLHRKEIFSKLLKNSTDERISYIKRNKRSILNPKTFRNVLTVSLWNGDVNEDFYDLFILLLEKGVYSEDELDFYLHSLLKNA